MDGVFGLTELSELSIILLNYNTLELVKRCLKHLDSMGASDILIVDNASTDGSREWLQTLHDDRVHCIFSSRNLGFAGGCNLGIQRATGKYILLLNTDAFPESQALEILVAYLEQHPEVGIVGPQLLYPDGRWQRSTGRVPAPFSSFLDTIGITSLAHVAAAILWPLTGRWWTSCEVEYVDGACMLIRHDVVDQIGDLDESFFFFVEDAEYCARARQHGWKVVYVPQSHVIHFRGSSSARKNYEKTVKLRALSEKRFILKNQSEKALHWLVFWRRVNFYWRMWLAQLLRQQGRYQRYQTAYQVYAELLHADCND